MGVLDLVIWGFTGFTVIGVGLTIPNSCFILNSVRFSMMRRLTSSVSTGQRSTTLLSFQIEITYQFIQKFED